MGVERNPADSQTKIARAVSGCLRDDKVMCPSEASCLRILLPVSKCVVAIFWILRAFIND